MSRFQSSLPRHLLSPSKQVTQPCSHKWQAWCSASEMPHFDFLVAVLALCIWKAVVKASQLTYMA